MKIVSFNLNGIRAAIKKGLLEWLTYENADIYCFQEIKIDDSLISEFKELLPNYQSFFHCAQKKGYSGVAIYSKIQPNEELYGVNHEEFDSEGRNICLYFPGFALMNTYYPSGTTGSYRQIFKEAFMDHTYKFIQDRFISENIPLIQVGDFNICHQPIDIHHPERHKNVSGFLPHEREWLSEYLDLGFVDSFRHLNPNPDHYTWWSYRAGARDKNLGWRIDYQMVNTSLSERIKNHEILKDIKMSDHCPIALNIDI